MGKCGEILGWGTAPGAGALAAGPERRRSHIVGVGPLALAPGPSRLCPALMWVWVVGRTQGPAEK